MNTLSVCVLKVCGQNNQREVNINSFKLEKYQPVHMISLNKSSVIAVGNIRNSRSE